MVKGERTPTRFSRSLPVHSPTMACSCAMRTRDGPLLVTSRRHGNQAYVPAVAGSPPLLLRSLTMIHVLINLVRAQRNSQLPMKPVCLSNQVSTLAYRCFSSGLFDASNYSHFMSAPHRAPRTSVTSMFKVSYELLCRLPSSLSSNNENSDRRLSSDDV